MDPSTARGRPAPPAGPPSLKAAAREALEAAQAEDPGCWAGGLPSALAACV